MLNSHYNNFVEERFKIESEIDNLVHLIVSRPDYFEKGVIPFIKKIPECSVRVSIGHCPISPEVNHTTFNIDSTSGDDLWDTPIQLTRLTLLQKK